MKNYIIGCGGGGSWVAPALCLLVQPQSVVLVDGDTLEQKNLNRQLFTPADIGKNKATALAARYGCDQFPEWYNTGAIEHAETDWLFGCVDNNPARVSILDSCDRYGCRAVFACNETTSAEAFLYDPRWCGGPNDPRTYYPQIVTDETNDPQAVAIGCTGAAQVQTPQLVTANLMSASLALHLYVAWAIELPKRGNPRDVEQFFPHRLIANRTQLETFKPLTVPILETA